MALRLHPRRITQALGIIVVILVLAHVAIQTLRFMTGNDRLHGLVFLFSLGAETNIPTFYATFSLLLTALLLAVVGFSHQRDSTFGRAYWLVLAGIFLFLSMDEMLSFHERMIDPLRNLIGSSGLFLYAWVIPYGIAVGILGGAYTRFLLSLPRRTALLFFLAGGLFVTGAIGFEMFGGWHMERYGSANPWYVAIQTIEEVLEMVGILIFIYALLDYADQHLGGLKLDIASATAEGPPGPS
jgi:hypothetical protein